MVGAENQDCYGINAFILLLQFKYYKVKNQATNKKSSLRYLCTLHFVKLWSFFSLHEWIACFKTPEILENWGEKKTVKGVYFILKTKKEISAKFPLSMALGNHQLHVKSWWDTEMVIGEEIPLSMVFGSPHLPGLWFIRDCVCPSSFLGHCLHRTVLAERWRP